MTSMLAANIFGAHPFKQDLKFAEHAEHVEFVEHVPDVEEIHTQDIHLDCPSDVRNSEREPTEPSPSLLTLPFEIRLRIYELAYNATFLYSKLEWEEGLKLQLQGTANDSFASTHLTGSPFTLLRVCRRLNAEVSPMLPSISDVAFEFDNFSEDDMHSWLDTLSNTQIARMRSFNMTGWESCQLKNPLYTGGHRVDYHRDQNLKPANTVSKDETCGDLEGQDRGFDEHAKLGLCDRSLALNLNAYERQFQAERFDRIVNQSPLDGAGQSSQREFHKACYLLRVLDGCVVRPAPKSHPAGRKSQCGTLDVVEAAVAAFVGDDGGLVVTRSSVVSLLRAAMGSQ